MPAHGTVGFVSLGCPKALVDSERILTQLRVDGYDIVGNYDDADVVVVNTCGFIDSAVAESLDTIGEALNENGKVIVTGCLGVHPDVIREQHPNVLAITGPQQYESVVSEVHKHVPIPEVNPHLDLIPRQLTDTGVKLTPRHYAYLKISEGCNHKCSFCIIPSMRGKLQSRNISDVMGEAQRLAAAGVKELLVIAQDTSAYGVDIKYQKGSWLGNEYDTRFEDLCVALGRLGIWARLHYVYPYPHVDKVIHLMAEGKILPYLDIPLQHGSPSVLKRMKRPAAAVNTLERIKKWREICPEITIRSTFIVGFPGETDEEFEELLAFLKQAQLDRVGCFQYSPVEGARANALENHVPDAIKEARWHKFMQTQQAISSAKLQNKIGSTQRVLVDEILEDVIIARSEADAPEIDGLVKIDPHPEVKVGEFYEVLIDDADEYDLFGKIKP
ncbi:MAG: 30S ribosomal protein S12 methylthiotransferase RimO [Gammaproteobacteria bacterium]|nr:30S ribosomal protein S12 methylthiotransferase RimO [Gammaproteobacteria bacterium]NNC97114.1 30S ribosomal protein S12 methylthiotransferase RimO [Gammaproteobacteria bacterium]NNM14126.1 30S ribosomal protein S12 methylthiotransferase RimO [Gammaproteobacteria bacterium]